MATDSQARKLNAVFQKTPYAQWIEHEGLPVHVGFGLEDVRQLELVPWPRLGGRGAFIQLYGMMEGARGMYVAEIPPKSTLEPEKHIYEEMICILEGQGATEVWQEGGRKQMFEWDRGSLFAPPLNTWHRMYNGGNKPAKFLGVSNAPLILNAYRNVDFVFNCPYTFSDRFASEDDFFAVGKKQYKIGVTNIWETNFIPDVKEANLRSQELKGAGVKITQFEMAGNMLVGHLAEWPAGRYHKAHYHGPGALLLGLESHGYVLMWSKELGTQPYSGRHADDVVEMEWKEGSIYSPLNGWFHQHFNTGTKLARHLAIRYGSLLIPGGGNPVAPPESAGEGVLTDMKEGGTLIEYADEDPEVRRRYEEALKKTGVPCQMP